MTGQRDDDPGQTMRPAYRADEIPGPLDHRMVSSDPRRAGRQRLDRDETECRTLRPDGSGRQLVDVETVREYLGGTSVNRQDLIDSLSRLLADVVLDL